MNEEPGKEGFITGYISDLIEGIGDYPEGYGDQEELEEYGLKEQLEEVYQRHDKNQLLKLHQALGQILELKEEVDDEHYPEPSLSLVDLHEPFDFEDFKVDEEIIVVEFERESGVYTQFFTAQDITHQQMQFIRQNDEVEIIETMSYDEFKARVVEDCEVDE